ncbi:MAG: cbb3-type cytochrome c oxidase subunit II [Verrucomicrobiota bacterium]
MDELRKFTIKLALCFGLPWLFLIVLPWFWLSSLEPVPYGEDDEEFVGSSYPPGESGLHLVGQRVFAAEGCAYCHTQMVRPTYAGSDIWRGWGGRSEGGFARSTRPRDYFGEPIALLGARRYGSDLSNVGWRRPDAAWLHEMLYDPIAYGEVTNKPTYAHLYVERRVESAPADDAVRVWIDEETGEEYEAVPTSEAKALVDYLLSLKKDYRVPVALVDGSGS